MNRFVLILLLVPWAVWGGEWLRISSSIEAMGTTFTIVAYDESRSRLETAVDEAFEEVQRLDSMLSNYNKDSEWSRVNREAAAAPVVVSPELYRLLEACQGFSRASDGAFDISVGPLIKVWGFYKGSGRLPHRAEIRNALARTGYRKIELNPDDRTVRFRQQGVEIDPGGIGKGYAVDRMVATLRKAGITSALVSGGGSSIYALGTPPGNEGWEVRIRDPKTPSKVIENLLLKNESMSTSGTYEKFFYAGGKMYSHIFDPRTGYPAEGILSVSVVAPLTLDSEAWTKPFFVQGRSWSARNKPDDFRVFICEDGLDVACAWLQ
jgi:thiamine biosynthesis lipoprotein